MFYILQHDITHAFYIHMYTIEAKYVYSRIKLYVLLHKQLIKSVKKNQVYSCLWLINTSFYLSVGACVYVIDCVCVCDGCLCVCDIARLLYTQAPKLIHTHIAYPAE